MSRKDNKDMEENILKAAEDVFLEKGYALASTTEIARRAGCNQTLVHYYFRTKEKLFESFFEKIIIMFITSFQSVYNQDLPFREKFRNLINSHFEFLLANQRIPFLVLNELTTNPDRMQKLKENFKPRVKEIFGHFSRDVEQAVKAGEIREIDTFELLFTMASLNISVFVLKPIVQEIISGEDDKFLDFAKKRKQENINLLLNSLTARQDQTLPQEA